MLLLPSYIAHQEFRTPTPYRPSPPAQPQPRHDPRADRKNPRRLPRRRACDLARTGSSARPRHGGHIDAIAQYIRPGVILLDAPSDPNDLNHDAGQDNLVRLRSAHDTAGRAIETVVFEAGTPSATAYMNHYLVNGGVIVPADGEPNDEAALPQLRATYPDRELVTVPGSTILAGGGGPHCITQQIPAGTPLA